jgi:hypothetical protein
MGAEIRPKLKTRQIAYEPGADPVLVKAVEMASRQMGFQLNINNPCHLGIAIELWAGDYLAGLAGCHLDAGLNRFPGNWAK